MRIGYFVIPLNLISMLVTLYGSATLGEQDYSYWLILLLLVLFPILSLAAFFIRKKNSLYAVTSIVFSLVDPIIYLYLNFF